VQSLCQRTVAGKIYTSTGPILLAVNPFKSLGLYSREVLGEFKRAGEARARAPDTAPASKPHAFGVADTAYRAMVRALKEERGSSTQSSSKPGASDDSAPCEAAGGDGGADGNAAKGGGGKYTTGLGVANQSILVSGESGAGKTVTTKIVMQVRALLSSRIARFRPTRR
jgi:myosin-5